MRPHLRDHPGVIAQSSGGTCQTCDGPIVEGERIVIHRERWSHMKCWAGEHE